MAGKRRWNEFRLYPTYERAYKRAFEEMLQVIHAEEIPTKWKSAEDVFSWWMEEKEAELMNLIESCAQGDCSEEAFDREYKEITEELKTLRRERGQASREKQLADAYEQRVEEMDRYVKLSKVISKEFDDDLVWRLIQTVKVINQNKIEIQFRSGIVMAQRLDLWE